MGPQHILPVVSKRDLIVHLTVHNFSGWLLCIFGCVLGPIRSLLSFGKLEEHEQVDAVWWVRVRKE
jgi:uncharacterized membrane protein (DUF373 family)